MNMKIHHSILLIAIAACLSGFTDKDVELAHRAAEKTRDALAACLQTEIKSGLTLRMIPADFDLYLKGACINKAQTFSVPFIDYLAMKHPDIAPASQIEQANAISRNSDRPPCPSRKRGHVSS